MADILDIRILMGIAEDLREELPDQSEAFYLEAIAKLAEHTGYDLANTTLLPRLISLYEEQKRLEDAAVLRAQLAKLQCVEQN